MKDDLIIDRTWFAGDKPITFDEVVDAAQMTLVIGTDSHRQGSRKRVFATAVCPSFDEDSRMYWWARRTLRKRDVPNLNAQIFIEAQQSIDVALEVLKRSPVLIPDDITIHVDCSPESSRHKSGRSAKTVKNIVEAYGFKCVIKPSSPWDPVPWAASAVGDRHAR